jgi:hypothetical protein
VPGAAEPYFETVGGDTLTKWRRVAVTQTKRCEILSLGFTLLTFTH